MADPCWRATPSTRSSPWRGASGLPYGPGSPAASVPLTPTFTFDRFVLRGDHLHTALHDIAKGDAATGLTGSGFGHFGDRTGQDRSLVECGITS